MSAFPAYNSSGAHVITPNVHATSPPSSRQTQCKPRLHIWGPAACLSGAGSAGSLCWVLFRRVHSSVNTALHSMRGVCNERSKSCVRVCVVSTTECTGIDKHGESISSVSTDSHGSYVIACVIVCVWRCRYASALLGISNTAGALPGVLGVTLAGVLLDQTNNWATAVFLPIAAIQVFGTIIYTIFASSERRLDW